MLPKRGNISTDQVREVIAEEDRSSVAGHWGGGFNREIFYFHGSETFEVEDHRKIVYRGTDLEEAVSTYNNIGPR